MRCKGGAQFVPEATSLPSSMQGRLAESQACLTAALGWNRAHQAGSRLQGSGRRTFCQSAMVLTSSKVSVCPQHSGGTSTPVTILPLKQVPASRSRYACPGRTSTLFQGVALKA